MTIIIIIIVFWRNKQHYFAFGIQYCAHSVCASMFQYYYTCVYIHLDVAPAPNLQRQADATLSYSMYIYIWLLHAKTFQ